MAASKAGEFFRINFLVRSEGDGRPLYIKNDGERFKADNRTVKVLCGHKYKVEVTIRPPSSSPSRVSWGGFDLEKKEEKVDGSSGLFIYGWDTTAVEPSKSGTRSQLPVIVFLENGEQVRFSLQCKYYKANDESHYRWGDELKGVELECTTTGDMGGTVKVTKTSFR